MSRRLVTVVALVLALAACSGDDDTATEPTFGTSPAAVDTRSATTAVPSVTTATPPTSSMPTTTGVVPEGFGTVAGRVTAADGSTCDVCLWAAVAAADQSRGLMGVTDLGGADGMVFRYSSPVVTQFWMRDTLMPLSIAFFAADGSFVSASDMEPCLTGPADACARYAPTAPYVNAIEVPKGGLEALLMTSGSRLELFDVECPLRTG